jgi:hypothetical protein
MGSVVNRPESQPTLQLAFADLQKRSEPGTELTLDCKLYNLPKPDSIPDYGRQPDDPFGIGLHADISANHEFLRDIAQFVYRYGILQPLGFVVKNPSTVAATNVNLRFRLARLLCKCVRKMKCLASLPLTSLRTWWPGRDFTRVAQPFPDAEISITFDSK